MSRALTRERSPLAAREDSVSPSQEGLGRLLLGLGGCKQWVPAVGPGGCGEAVSCGAVAWGAEECVGTGGLSAKVGRQRKQRAQVQARSAPSCSISH